MARKSASHSPQTSEENDERTQTESEPGEEEKSEWKDEVEEDSSSHSTTAQEDGGSDSETESDTPLSNFKVQPIVKPSTNAEKRSVQEVINGDLPLKSNSKKAKVEDGKWDFWSKYPFLDMSFRIMVGNHPSLALSENAMGLIKRNLGLVGDAKAKELNANWQQLIAEEVELNCKMMTLMKEQIELALDK